MEMNEVTILRIEKGVRFVPDYEVAELAKALGVSCEWASTHIAGLPVAVTICCHAMRHSERVL